MMKKGLIIAVVMLSASCSISKVSEKEFYLLDVKTTAQQNQTSPQQRSGLIWVNTVDVSDFLSQQGLVYQTSDNQYNVAQQNVWLTPLNQQFIDIISTVFSQQFPSTLVSLRRVTSPNVEITLKIDGFHGRYDGKVVVKGKWFAILNGKKETFYTQDFDYLVDLPQDGYDTLVEVLSKTFQQEVVRFADQLKTKM